MKKVIRVDLGDRSYDIVISDEFIADVLPLNEDSRVMVVTDSNVAEHHLVRIKELLSETVGDVFDAIVPAGEESKELEMVGKLYADAVTAGLDRKSSIIAFGGGMVGDLAGFTGGV